MRYTKGHIGYWKGKTLTKEHRISISNATQGIKKPSIQGENNPSKRPQVRKKISDNMKINNPNFRKEVRDKTRKRMKLNNPMMIKEYRIKVGKALKGRILSKEHFDKLQEGRRNTIIPTQDTSIEVKIQDFLKQMKIDFFTHQHINIEHSYQCDIFIPSKNLVIECDGNYWHKYPTGRNIDHIRTLELLQKGFKVLRLWEFEIKDMELNDFEKRFENVTRA